MWYAFVPLVWSALPVYYERHKLFELVLCADAVVQGEIERVEHETFELRIDRTIAGHGLSSRIEVARFVNWTCASRWTSYERGQPVLLFLRRSENGYRILGGGGEGEMPLVEAGVVVRGYEVRGYGLGPHRVGSVEVEGALVSLEELALAIQRCREIFAWEPDERGQVKRVLPRGGPDSMTAFAQASRTAQHLVEEARSSAPWEGAEEHGIRLEDLPPRVSARALGLAGVARIPRRPPKKFDFEMSFSFGRAVASIGDVDGDGMDEWAVGAPGDGLKGHQYGALWILFRRPEDGSPRSWTEISEETGGFSIRLNDFAHLGEAVAPLGDLDGDGIPEVAVGASGWKSSRRGGVWILFLTRSGTVSRMVELGEIELLREAGVEDGFGLGKSLATLGDLDGDGLPELAIGEDPAFDFGQERGRVVLIVSLDASGAARWVRRIHSRADVLVRRHSWFGDALAGIGDVDEDGVPDLAVSDIYDQDGGPQRGAIWIVFLRSDGTFMKCQKISDWAGGFEGFLRDDEVFGTVLAGPGDLDGDGTRDLFAGSASGIWTLFLNEDGTVRAHRLLENVTRAGERLRLPCSLAWSGAGEHSFLVVGGSLRRNEQPDAVLWTVGVERDGSLFPR